MHITCVTFDCADSERVAHFWADALGWQATAVGEDTAASEGKVWVAAQPHSSGLYLEFVPVPEPKTVKNRLHLGTQANVEDLDTEIARLESLGARVAWEEEFPDNDTGYRNVVLRDPEGNELCLGWHPPATSI